MSTAILSESTAIYMHSFESYATKFMVYGKEFFAVLFAINIAWLAMWYAFDKDSLVDSLSGFIKKFFIAMIFYMLMISPSWLASIISSTTAMGKGITGATGVDPTSIINQGFDIGFKMLDVIKKTSILKGFFSSLTMFFTFIIIIFCFMNVALEVAVTQIVSTALAMFACFSLSFSGFGATASIARNTIDALIGNCFKLLGYYIVIGTATTTFTGLAGSITESAAKNLKICGWLCACTLLMWLLSKNLPAVFEKIGGGLAGEIQGATVSSMAMSAVKGTASVVKSIANRSKGGGDGGGGNGTPPPSPSSGGAKGFQESSWSKSKTAANDSNTKGPNNTGGGQMQVKAPGGTSANDAVGKSSTQNSASSNSNNKSTPQNNAANDSHTGKGGGSTKGASAAGSGRARTYPGMSKDKPKQAIGA